MSDQTILNQGEGINKEILNGSDELSLEESETHEVNPSMQNRCNHSGHACGQQRVLAVPITHQSIVTDSSENNNNSDLGDVVDTDSVVEDSNCVTKYYLTDEEDIACNFMKLFTCIGKKAKYKEKVPQIDPFRQTQWKLLSTTNEHGAVPKHPYIQQLRADGRYSSGTHANAVERPPEVSRAKEHLYNINDISQSYLTDPDHYDFSHLHRGYAIIIVNQDFARLNPRNGADVDLSKTREVLRKLGYLNKNVQRHNLDKESTLAILHDARDADHSKMDSFALIISSHGNEVEHPRNGKREHVIYCSDDQYIFTGDILEMFSDENCPSLKGKPKLFFIQACRGLNTDDGAQIRIHDPNDLQDHSLSSRSNHDGKSPEEETLMSEFESSLIARVQCQDDTDARSFEDIWDSKPIVNCNNDCLVMYAAPSGHCAWRSNDDGSWMLHYLWQEVMSYDYRNPCSFLKILTAVSRKMSDRETNVPDNPMKSSKKAIPVITHHLDKDIVFREKEQKYVCYTKTTVSAHN